VVTAATWLPSGPLAALTRGNSTSESRTYTTRYFPQTIELTAPQPLAWAYETDPVGNITHIEACAGDLVLTNETIATATTRTSCASLFAGPSFTVSPTGDLTLAAAEKVVLRDGFSVAEGGRLTVNVDPTLATSDARDFAYQDVQYYLTRADGPWGERDWSYDRIGNRLTETRNRSGSAEQDAYLYEPNSVLGNTPILDEILLAFGGARDYTWGAAGHLAQVASGGNQVDLAADAASRMSEAARSDGTTTFADATFTYDGRSYLTAATDPAAGTSVTPVYSSEGLLMALGEHTGPTLDRRHLILYFAGHPTAQWTDTNGTETWHHYTTDHLGTPIVATGAGGNEIWRSSLDPWGNDPAAGTGLGALENNVFLRMPGQWHTGLWTNASLGSGPFLNNVHRWYGPTIGRYTKPDPLGISASINLYSYAESNPIVFFDLLGKKVCRCNRRLATPLAAIALDLDPIAHHTYVQIVPDERDCGGYDGLAWGFQATDGGRVLPENSPVFNPQIDCREVACIDEHKLIRNIVRDMRSPPYDYQLVCRVGRGWNARNCQGWADDVLERSRTESCCEGEK
jgi:RHS repeat-associated protein